MVLVFYIGTQQIARIQSLDLGCYLLNYIQLLKDVGESNKIQFDWLVKLNYVRFNHLGVRL